MYFISLKSFCTATHKQADDALSLNLAKPNHYELQWKEIKYVRSTSGHLHSGTLIVERGDNWFKKLTAVICCKIIQYAMIQYFHTIVDETVIHFNCRGLLLFYDYYLIDS